MHPPREPASCLLRSADERDVEAIAQLVNAAYEHYIERIGMLPGPMTLDYASVIADRQVTVAESDGSIVGVIVIGLGDESFVIENVAVHPSRRGLGVGRTLLEFAEREAVRSGFDAIHLYTHESMIENLALYTRIGYVEYERRSQGSFCLVYMRKSLTSREHEPSA
jgi:ribosomal protein S18 acetylase RimI-like enzyme